MTYSATDLANYLGCSHLALLDRASRRGGPKAPQYADPALEVLRQRGLEHEHEYEEELRSQGLEVRRIEEPSRSQPREKYWEEYTAATLEAMLGGADVIVRGGLWDGSWAGKPDFLMKVPAEGDESDWNYDVVDTKLAREAKGTALLQVLLYADLVTRVLGRPVEHVHLELGGPEPRTESFRVKEYAAYFRSARRRFLELQETAPETLPTAPEPVAHCGNCAWRGRCDEERRAADHLSLVAGISRRQREALRENGVSTLEQLAMTPLVRVEEIGAPNAASLRRMREQARVQYEGRIRGGAPYHELLLPVQEGEGLAALPEPSPGDLFFDLEGNPFAFTYGIEYLFGWADADGAYHARWALTREEERRVFEEFIDLVVARRAEYPDLHIYHFAPYEPSALRRLMSAYGTREPEIDHLLRAGVFVDLLRVVRQGVRASVESYSIKKLEPFYGFERDVDLREASIALARFDAWLEMGLFADERTSLRAAVEGYNRDDCLSTLRLRQWLERLRMEAESVGGLPVPRPLPGDGGASPEAEERAAEIALRYDALTADVPLDEELRSPEQHARWLLAQLLEFHRREKKAKWWEFFRCMDLNEVERIEDRATLGGISYVGVVGVEKQSEIHEYRFPPQEHAIRRDARDPANGKPPGTIVAIDAEARRLLIKRGKRSVAPHPESLIPFEDVPDGGLRESILRVADAVLESGFGPGSTCRSAAALLSRKYPLAERAGAALQLEGEETLDAARRLVLELDGAVLPIQGPPGAGKTYTAAAMIVTAISAGKRVGITANSHKVISHLLKGVVERARTEGVKLVGIQKGKEDEWCGEPEILRTESNSDVQDALSDGTANLAAGTAWLWSREEMTGSVEILFIDEAGQFLLASAVAVAAACNSLVLLGDPRQLEQPQQGVHPPGADVSVLDNLLGEEATVPADRGLFLAETWRLNPEICAFTSEIFYEGRLRSRDGLERQVLRDAVELPSHGLCHLRVEHTGNQSESPEEAEAVSALVRKLTSGCSWVDGNGIERPLGLDDVLVVAPYNAQVDLLRSLLPNGARVGTVDKFQGQEAPVVIYSVTTSSADEAPRGMEFLYSPNRLNVATSRARCLAIVVAAPSIFMPDCATPRQMKLANAFCRYQELAMAAESALAGLPDAG
jgi:predicted RecB family nuclease